MNLGFKVAVFMICINIAAGIMNIALPDLPVTEDYDTTQATLLASTITNTSINPSGGVGSDPDTFGDRVLDFIHLGWIKQVTDFLYGLLYGFSGLLEKIFGIYYLPYKIYINLGITAAYGLSIIMLWLGRRLD